MPISLPWSNLLRLSSTMTRLTNSNSLTMMTTRSSSTRVMMLRATKIPPKTMAMTVVIATLTWIHTARPPNLTSSRSTQSIGAASQVASTPSKMLSIIGRPPTSTRLTLSLGLAKANNISHQRMIRAIRRPVRREHTISMAV